ncbi:MAG: ribonuclease HIII [Nitrospirales bacterium]
MVDKLTSNLAAFDTFIAQNGWKIWTRKDIEYGHQVVVTDGTIRLPVNFYGTGKIVPQGKSGAVKTSIVEWANLQQFGIGSNSAPSSVEVELRKNLVAKYLVLPDRVEVIRDVLAHLPGELDVKDLLGPAEIYRIEVRASEQRATVTQYTSGTLMIQGLSGSLFQEICDVLDEHLSQSFSARAARYIPGETERADASSYLESPDAENEAADWLYRKVDREVLEFLYPNDKLTLLAAAGVRNAFLKSEQSLPDYSVVVMPFAKPYEGFLIRLAIHLDLVTENAVSRKSNTIEVGVWLDAIRTRLPDIKRYSEIADTLKAAWGCRNKAMHSDPIYSLSTLKKFDDAEEEVNAIFRAINRAYSVFVVDNIRLTDNQKLQKDEVESSKDPDHKDKFSNVDIELLRRQLEVDGLNVRVQAEGRNHIWEILDKPNLTVVAPRNQKGLIIVNGKDSPAFCAKYAKLLEAQPIQTQEEDAWIGVDESGKGDVFGPLVVAAVLVTPEIEIVMVRQGVRDSKALSDTQISAMAKFIKENCQYEILTLSPPEYNAKYEEHGRNLNYLLAWGHAHVITKLSRRTEAGRAISDQFGDESLIINALSREGCTISLEQRPRAESDIAVASASILARAQFLTSLEDCSIEFDAKIPRGGSSFEIKQVGKMIFERLGREGLEKIAKMHFKTVSKMMGDG